MITGSESVAVAVAGPNAFVSNWAARDGCIPLNSWGRVGVGGPEVEGGIWLYARCVVDRGEMGSGGGE